MGGLVGGGVKGGGGWRGGSRDERRVSVVLTIGDRSVMAWSGCGRRVSFVCEGLKRDRLEGGAFVRRMVFGSGGDAFFFNLLGGWMGWWAMSVCVMCYASKKNKKEADGGG